MTSDRQIDANRRNAQASTGPKTPDGKMRSSQNAYRHGLSARKRIVAVGESPREYTKLWNDLVAYWQPANALELAHLEAIASNIWRLRRCDALECSVINRMSGARDAISDAEAVGEEMWWRKLKEFDNQPPTESANPSSWKPWQQMKTAQELQDSTAENVTSAGEQVVDGNGPSIDAGGVSTQKSDPGAQPPKTKPRKRKLRPTRDLGEVSGKLCGGDPLANLLRFRREIEKSLQFHFHALERSIARRRGEHVPLAQQVDVNVTGMLPPEILAGSYGVRERQTPVINQRATETAQNPYRRRSPSELQLMRSPLHHDIESAALEVHREGSGKPVAPADHRPESGSVVRRPCSGLANAGYEPKPMKVPRSPLANAGYEPPQ